MTTDTPKQPADVYKKSQFLYTSGGCVQKTEVSMHDSGPAGATPLHTACRACGRDYGDHDGTRCPTGVESHFRPAAATVPGDEREAFEAWMLTGELDLSPNLERYGEYYEDFNVTRSWRGWQAHAALAAPAAPRHQPINWPAVTAAVKEYAEGYELIGDGGDHIPTDTERFLIVDAIHGLLADDEFMALLAGVPAAQDAPQEQAECERCGLTPEEHTWAHWCDNQSFKEAVAPQAGEDAQPVGTLECHVSGDGTFWPDEKAVLALPIGDHPLYATPQPAPQAAPAVPESRNE